MHSPTKDQFLELANDYNLVPVFRAISADLETPVSAFLKVANGPYSFLFESVEGGERHWHGAGDTGPMTHLALNVAGHPPFPHVLHEVEMHTTWFEKVTDDEYDALLP